MNENMTVSGAAIKPGQGALAGRRVMIVEDELLVAMLLEEALVEHGCEIVGPFSTVETALLAARGVVADVAVLDVNLRGKRVYPVARTAGGARHPVPADVRLWAGRRAGRARQLGRLLQAVPARRPGDRPRRPAARARGRLTSR